jgi:hypothetical protein
MMENEGFMPLDATYATRSIHEGQDPDQWSSRAVVPPITMACVFKLDKIPDFPKHNSTVNITIFYNVLDFMSFCCALKVLIFK